MLLRTSLKKFPHTGRAAGYLPPRAWCPGSVNHQRLSSVPGVSIGFLDIGDTQPLQKRPFRSVSSRLSKPEGNRGGDREYRRRNADREGTLVVKKEAKSGTKTVAASTAKEPEKSPRKAAGMYPYPYPYPYQEGNWFPPPAPATHLVTAPAPSPYGPTRSLAQTRPPVPTLAPYDSADPEPTKFQTWAKYSSRNSLFPTENINGNTATAMSAPPPSSSGSYNASPRIQHNPTPPIRQNYRIRHQDQDQDQDQRQHQQQTPQPSPSRSRPRPSSPERDQIHPPSAESGGTPEPTAAYLLRASFLPQRAPAPRPLLVVIDLNGTLLHRPSSRRAPHRFVARRHAAAFLSYCVDTFHVAVWSSARPDNVRAMLRQLATPAQLDRVVAVWGRDRFGLSREDYASRTQCYKRLTMLWSDPAVAASHPLGEAWNQGNTVLVDDSAEKARSEPFNAVTLPEFTGAGDNPAVLPLVHDYLNTLACQLDVSMYIRAHPFKVEDAVLASSAPGPTGV